MRALLLTLILVVAVAGCTRVEDPTADPTPTPTQTATPSPTTPSPTAPPTGTTTPPGSPTPPASPTPTATLTPPPAPSRIERSFDVTIPAALESPSTPAVYTSNCVRVDGDATTRLLGGTANATWNGVGGLPTTLDLISNPSGEEVTRVTGPPPLTLDFTYEATNATTIQLQLPENMPAAAVQQEGTIDLVLYFTGTEPTFAVAGCSLHMSR